MEKHKCRLCLKSYPNGRALGGHMRSHMLNLPVPPKLAPQSPEFSQSSEEDEEKGQLYGLRENPKRSIRLVDPEFSFPVDAAAGSGGSVVVQDRESETESSENPTRKRSSRTQDKKIKKCKFIQLSKAESWPEPEPVSSISDTTNEEDVAYCLMMLSRDKWKKKKEQSQQETEEEDDSESDSKLCKNRTRGKYKCETGKKVFKSYQALGGHKASHNKIKLNRSPVREVAANVGKEDKKIHECPVCFRVFPSGQALGGHKRSHVTSSVTRTTTTTTTTPAKDIRTENNFIDLNFPAPIDDDEDYSQFELSAVSDD